MVFPIPVRMAVMGISVMGSILWFHQRFCHLAAFARTVVFSVMVIVIVRRLMVTVQMTALLAMTVFLLFPVAVFLTVAVSLVVLTGAVHAVLVCLFHYKSPSYKDKYDHLDS